MWIEKHNRWIEKNSVRIFVLASASLCFAPPASAQCQGKTGFALQACTVAAATGGNANAGIPAGALSAGKGEPMLSSGLADSITGADTLPGSVDPDLKLFSPLLKLHAWTMARSFSRPGCTKHICSASRWMQTTAAATVRSQVGCPRLFAASAARWWRRS